MFGEWCRREVLSPAGLAQSLGALCSPERSPCAGVGVSGGCLICPDQPGVFRMEQKWFRAGEASERAGQVVGACPVAPRGGSRPWGAGLLVWRPRAEPGPIWGALCGLGTFVLGPRWAWPCARSCLQAIPCRQSWFPVSPGPVLEADQTRAFLEPEIRVQGSPGSVPEAAVCLGMEAVTPVLGVRL